MEKEIGPFDLHPTRFKNYLRDIAEKNLARMKSR
jgi:hypothetical protein